MYINLFLIPYVIILGLLLGMKDTPRNRRWYIFLCSAVLLFVGAMRSPEWMTYTYNIDTLNYKDYFEKTCDMGWNEVWAAIVGRYFGMNEDFDIGFVALQKFIGIFTSDFAIYSLLADLIFWVPFSIILYRYTTSMKQLVFAFVFYLSLVQIYFFGGARQIFAMGFDLMAFIARMDRKKVQTIFFFVIGVSIHFSSFLFAVPLLFIWFNTEAKSLKFIHLICFLLFPVVLLNPREVIVFMGETSGLEKYVAYGKGAIQGGATTFIILIELLSLFCLIAIKRKIIADNMTIRNIYVMAPLFTLLAPLIIANGSMTRISLYYYLFLSLLVPFALDCMFSKKERAYGYIVAIGALAILTFSSGGIVYYFYWQL